MQEIFPTQCPTYQQNLPTGIEISAHSPYPSFFRMLSIPNFHTQDCEQYKIYLDT